ncbi:lytic murein transglycosylase [Albirhodobacter sp. R86504]|uniref:lytic murein transglycosylase n=1 Tax=Albirhodobacter sp. R86504 TaxID=3093848 RepID=UPI00366B8C93
MKQALRSFALSAVMLSALTACTGANQIRSSGSARAAIDPIPPVSREVQAGMDAWVVSFLPRARAAGISQATLDRTMRDVPFNPEVIERSNNQAEFKKSIWEYLDSAVSNTRVTTGRSLLSENDALFDKIEATYGVDREAVVAIWGMESNYGTTRGRTLIIPALSTLAYQGRRSSFFEQQLIGALKIIQSGDTDSAHMTGSWAGAMGHTQFIPTSYLAYAVDITGDGKRDIWSENPADALASTAAYLKRSGWQMGQPAMVEVTLPDGFNYGLIGKDTRKDPSAWAAMGVRNTKGGALPNAGAGSIILPGGREGAALMVFNNFRAILRYNNADAYGVGVAHLADRIGGGGRFIKDFPRDPNVLDESERMELQRKLTALGYDTGGTDGRTGSMTAAAVSAFQASRGMVVDGIPDRGVLDALR